ncbi:hypothetical protein AVEN_26695-1 [Araneus ventricosus]|uniref:Uncharacterized protein n=1 Tax=Araneus ventricosus TaxID=182803 RepID=A0A4Y2RL94_ARAVE|nr:hypothetical protein AVEN_26695-1 [Araneus ventricosus]
MNQDANSLFNRPYGSEFNANQCPSSYSCIFCVKGPIKTESSHVLPYQFKPPSNYYHGTYPLTVQVPEALPSINTDMFSEIHKFSENENDTIEGAYSTNKPSQNEIDMNQGLRPSAPNMLKVISILIKN